MLVQHWQKLLPGKILEVNYEDLVTRQLEQSQRLIKFTELEWQENCFNFYSSKKLVRTASVSQVRKPMYTSSVARWKPYEKALAPMIAILNKSEFTRDLMG